MLLYLSGRYAYMHTCVHVHGTVLWSSVAMANLIILTLKAQDNIYVKVKTSHACFLKCRLFAVLEIYMDYVMCADKAQMSANTGHAWFSDSGIRDFTGGL